MWSLKETSLKDQDVENKKNLLGMRSQDFTCSHMKPISFSFQKEKIKRAASQDGTGRPECFVLWKIKSPLARHEMFVCLFVGIRS